MRAAAASLPTKFGIRPRAGFGNVIRSRLSSSCQTRSRSNCLSICTPKHVTKHVIVICHFFHNLRSEGDIISADVDVRVAVGALVVFLIVGSVVFGVYYFGFYRPGRDDLERTRTAALSQIDQTLGNIGTSQAQIEASNLKSQVISAGSKEAIESALSGMSSIAARESERKQLLAKVDYTVAGTYHSDNDVTALATLKTTLEGEINNMTTLADLQAFESSGTIDTQATSAWQTYQQSSVVNNVNEFNQVLELTATYRLIMTKENALSLIGESSWQILRGMDFQDPVLVAIPITDSYDRAPDLRPGMVADIWVYDTGTENSSFLFGPAVILDTVYSSSDLSAISWILTNNYGTWNYSVDVWETLKALAAGSTDAANVDWENYALDIMDRVRSAHLGKFDVSVIYVVAVPEDLGILLSQYEQYPGLGKDVMLLPPLVSNNSWQYQAYQSYHLP
jgi:hypothetical protein